ncbi:hypothetical protein ACM46_16630 [Chryseobacterium angstadtii]|uniref:Uncharacterized protein n=1 Tax=Chryseobacterium angstadtii TaxID=558151 RepID=A0A0J7I5I2_9FLAO|nr:hypothetical protein ACM46_16630 [Chryseobacterium angstadtii]
MFKETEKPLNREAMLKRNVLRYMEIYMISKLNRREDTFYDWNHVSIVFNINLLKFVYFTLFL